MCVKTRPGNDSRAGSSIWRRFDEVGERVVFRRMFSKIFVEEREGSDNPATIPVSDSAERFGFLRMFLIAFQLANGSQFSAAETVSYSGNSSQITLIPDIRRDTPPVGKV